MTTLEPRYARYGLMASRTLAALDDLEERAAEEVRHVAPAPEDATRIERLQQNLETALGTGTGPSAVVYSLSGQHVRADTDVDDSTIVKRVLADQTSVEDFIPRALSILTTIRTDGIDALKQDNKRELLDFYP